MSNKDSIQHNIFSFFESQKVQGETQKIAIITACSKQKLMRISLAKNLYQGDIFRKTKRIAEKLRADFYILSAKYGLIEDSKVIRPYNTVLQYKKDIKALQETLDPALLAKLESYDKVFLIMGKNYKEVLAPFLSNMNAFLFHSERGLGGYKHVLSQLTAHAPERLVQALIEHSKSKKNEKKNESQ